ncbi:hypothetical protein LJR251_002771 [Rhizobium rhizogenes]|uniref:hypothetical protein n=1 Tax=Rhizobium rhizogenes TaxID=359 RepID=UPI003ED07B07
MAKKLPKVQVPKEERIDRYNSVVEAAQLNDIQLLNLSFAVNPAFFNENAENGLSYDVSLKETHYDSDAGAAVAFVECAVQARDGNEDTLLCTANYSIVYSLADRCDTEETKAFLQRVAPFACYPYFRGLFASLDWAANTHLPPLPIHKEAPPREKQRKRAKTITADA